MIGAGAGNLVSLPWGKKKKTFAAAFHEHHKKKGNPSGPIGKKSDKKKLKKGLRKRRAPFLNF